MTEHPHTKESGSALVLRRGFLKSVGAAALVPLIDPPNLLASVEDLLAPEEACSTTSCPASTHGAGIFREHVNTRFLVRDDKGSKVALTLASVLERKPEGPIEQFSLLFDAPEDVSDLQGIREFEHRTLGSMAIFIVPMGVPAASPRVYEACFTRFAGGSTPKAE